MTGQAGTSSLRPIWWWILPIWAVTAFVIFMEAGGLTPSFPMKDPDDALRLVQVRDLLNGQNWYDLTQYRINPADGGGPMHWSRFIDAQIAGLILLFQFIMSAASAEYLAITLYPLLLLLGLYVALFVMMRPLGNGRTVLTALLLVVTMVGFTHYYWPTRIDHHNWQLNLWMAMAAMAVGSPHRWRGIVTALCATILMEISLEGIVFLAICAALFALEWGMWPSAATRSRLAGMAIGLIIFPLIWVLAMRGSVGTFQTYCDSFSLPYIAACAVAGALTYGLLHFCPKTARWPVRAGGLALVSAGAATSFALIAPPCLAGPFSALDPLTRDIWYKQVAEGQPLWAVPLETLVALSIILFMSLAGIGACIWRDADKDRRASWIRMGFVLIGATLAALLVSRVSSSAMALAIPGCAVLVLRAWDWSRRQTRPLFRIVASLAVVLAVPAVGAGLGLALFHQISSSTPDAKEVSCAKAAPLAGLSTAVPMMTIAEINLGPAILAYTPHKVLATGHHRNHEGIRREILIFQSDVMTAESRVRAEGADLVLLCSGSREARGWLKGPKGSFAYDLATGNIPSWLRYDENLSRPPLRVYRVKPVP
jgi:hypothetical protein